MYRYELHNCLPPIWLYPISQAIMTTLEKWPWRERVRSKCNHSTSRSNVFGHIREGASAENAQRQMDHCSSQYCATGGADSIIHFVGF